MNKINNISNRSSVLPILCEHGQFSAILEGTQSDHSDCRHLIKACRRRNRVPSRSFSTLNRAESSYPVKSNRLLIKNGPNVFGNVGYCGADLKALCTEAALRALRRRYPQIYESRDKLQIDAASVSIAISDFYGAMRRIVPTAQRSMSSPARPLSLCVRPLLQRTFSRILKLFERIFPRALALIAGTGETGLMILFC